MLMGAGVSLAAYGPLRSHLALARAVASKMDWLFTDDPSRAVRTASVAIVLPHIPVNAPAAQRARLPPPLAGRCGGNGSHPVTASPHDGCCNVAPRRPHAEQRGCLRSTSDDASAPQRITKGTSATATR
jgi:hypothetical protein